MSELKIETELTRQIEELSHYLEFSTTHNVPLSKTKNKTSHVPVSFGRWGWWASQLRIFWTSISFPFGTSTFFLMKGWRVFMVLEHRERRESPEKYGRRPIIQTWNKSASSVYEDWYSQSKLLPLSNYHHNNNSSDSNKFIFQAGSNFL